MLFYNRKFVILLTVFMLFINRKNVIFNSIHVIL